MQLNTDETDYYRAQKRFWTINAPFYDLMVAPASRIRDEVVRFVDAPSRAKILDVATGTGKQAFAFAKRGYDVTGVDLSEAMLKVARRKNKFPNLKLQSADASSLSFADNTFDVASVSFALHEMPLSIREMVLREMTRVVKPGGTVVIIDFGLPDNKMWRFLIYNFVKAFEGSHYVKFIQSDLIASIEKPGIAIDGELKILWGGGRIIRGTRKA